MKIHYSYTARMRQRSKMNFSRRLKRMMNFTRRNWKMHFMATKSSTNFRKTGFVWSTIRVNFSLQNSVPQSRGAKNNRTEFEVYPNNFACLAAGWAHWNLGCIPYHTNNNNWMARTGRTRRESRMLSETAACAGQQPALARYRLWVG